MRATLAPTTAPVVSRGRGSTLPLPIWGWDALGCAIIALIVSAALVAWHAASISRVVPALDGSHHVATTANLAAGVRVQGLQFVADFANRFTPDVFTYTFLAIPTSVVGPGPIAFGIGWIVCLVAVCLTLFSMRPPGTAHLTAVLMLALLLFTGVFESHFGGAWDTRVDLFSVTLGLVALLQVARRNYFVAALLAIAAWFAKGAAVSLLIPLLCLGALLFVRPSQMTRLRWLDGIKLVVVVALAWLFATRIGPTAASYNLMATGGTTLDERVRLFVSNALTYLANDPGYYVDAVGPRARILVVASIAILVLFRVLHLPNELLKLGIFSVLAVLYTGVLLTISPLHSGVLAIWFLPALALMAVFVALVVTRFVSPAATAIAAGVVFVSVVPLLDTVPAAPDPTYAQPVASVMAQATQIAAFLDNRPAGSAHDVVLLDNFLSSDGPLVENYDAYRVLIQERLRKPDLTIDGWELGTFSAAWRPEFRSNMHYSEILLLLQEHASANGLDNAPQRASRQVWDDIHAFWSQHRDCMQPIADPIELPRVGRQEALQLSTDPTCRAAVALT